MTDFEIPKRYGLRQTIADTLGIGGIMRALRTIPVLIEMWALVDDLIAAHGECIPKPLQTNSREITATTDRTGVTVTGQLRLLFVVAGAGAYGVISRRR